MPTAKYFDRYPEFPSSVPTAEVPIISYHALQQQCPDESARLFQACKEYGFLLLNLQESPEGLSILKDAEAMYDLTNEIMDLDREILNQYAYKPPRNLNGYKAYGKHTTDGGHPDVTSLYMIGRDDILSPSESGSPHPPPVQARRNQCQTFCSHAHDIVITLLRHLDGNLDLAPNTLASLMAPTRPSDTGIRMIRSHPAALAPSQTITMGSHTDMGTITLLFNVVGGLQILPGNVENLDVNWRYVRPQQGCAVVNIGDTLVEWTGGVLLSGLHRVRDPPGPQAGAIRQSLAYLVRGAKDGSMRRLTGSRVIPPVDENSHEEEISVDDWTARRAQEIMHGKLRSRAPTEVSAERQVNAVDSAQR